MAVLAFPSMGYRHPLASGASRFGTKGDTSAHEVTDVILLRFVLAGHMCGPINLATGGRHRF